MKPAALKSTSIISLLSLFLFLDHPADRHSLGNAAAQGPSQAKDAGSQVASQGLADQAVRANNRGIAHLERYEYRAAAAEFQKALDLKPDFLPGIVNLGIAYYYDMNFAQAAEQFRAALQIDPDEPHSHFMLSLVLNKENQRDEALPHLRKVLELYPDDPATNYNAGLTLLRGQNFDQAARYFEKVLASDPRHLSAMYNLAMAFMRSGRKEAAQQLTAKIRELKGEEQAGTPMGTVGAQYRDEGRFAIAIEDYPWADQAAAGLPVRFVDVTSSSGIRFTHAGGASQLPRLTLPTELVPERFSKAWMEKNLVPALGSGAALLDYNNDGKVDIFLVNCGGDAAGARNALYRNNGDGSFTDVTAEAGLGKTGKGMGVAVGDYNNDGLPDIYVTNYGPNVLYRNDGNGRFSDVTAEAGVGGNDGKWSLSAVFFDYDHDGDLDLFVTNFVDLDAPPRKNPPLFPDDFAGQPNLLFRNNGNGTFTNVTDAAKVSAGGRSTAAAITDYNESRDIDLFVGGYGQAGHLFSNNRDGSFTDVAGRLKLSGASAAFGFGCGDLNGDGYPDFYFPDFRGVSAGRLMLNSGRGEFSEAMLIPQGFMPDRKGSGIGWGSTLFDYDNDGAMDILAIGDRLYLFRNLGQNRFRDVTADTGLASLRLQSARSLALGDLDGDGDLDLLVTCNGGRPYLLRNDGGNRNNYAKVRLEPLHDNKSALGAKVEIRSGLFRQKVEVSGYCSYLSQGGSAEVIFGLGNRKTADFVRILWPTGVLQSEIEPAANTMVKIPQLDRKGTSCPVLYAWNGSRYEFVTDFLGGSAVGTLIAPGKHNATDTDEYILIQASQLKEKQGFYSIKMNDQLEEVMFIDQVKLLAVDHPADIGIFPNERLMPGPPFPDFKIYAAKGSRPPVRAVDDRGHDLLPALRYVDRRYPDGFKLLPYKGYAQQHSITLDLGDLSSAKKVLLLLTAWIDYADSSSNLAASQAGIHLIPPYLEALNEQGEWVTVLKDMGFPAGLPKTMTVDLTGKLHSRKESRVRITTNMRIYWDQILVDTFADPAPLKVVQLDAAKARLGWGGYPREFSPDGGKPLQYDYSVRDLTAPWKSQLGNYTGYGDVKSLVHKKDDMYVVMLHGDEITLDFDAHALPPLPSGWSRSFLVYAAGFGKDMDLNSAFPDTVEPLPFQGMTGYPYWGHYPNDTEHREYLRKYNTRRVTSIYH